jgi:hypothetical protein
MSWLAAIYTLLGVIRDFFSWKKSADDRQAGADAANNAAREQNDARVKEANEAEIEAEKAHKTTADDTAFDNEFRRD